MRTIAEHIIDYLGQHQEATVGDLTACIHQGGLRQVQQALIKLEKHLHYIMRIGRRAHPRSGQKQIVYTLTGVEINESLLRARQPVAREPKDTGRKDRFSPRIERVAADVRRIIFDDECGHGREFEDVQVARHWTDVALFGEYRRVME